MHELSVMKSILDTVLEHAAQHDVEKIRAIKLEVGMLSNYQEEWMQRYFGYLSKGTMAQEARLEIKWVPIVFMCRECQESFEIDRTEVDEITCPDCGQKRISLLSGREYVIQNMEVE